MILLEEFHKHFKPVELAFSKKLTEGQADFWHEEVREKDYQVFVETCKRLKYGDKFPTPKMFMGEYRHCEQALGKATDAGEIPSCPSCFDGKIYMDDELVRNFIFKCGECNPWQLKGWPTVTRADVARREANGWRLEWPLQKKWDAIASGTWKEEDERLSTNLTKGLLKGLKLDKAPDKVKEATRQRNIEAVEETEVPF